MGSIRLWLAVFFLAAGSAAPQGGESTEILGVVRDPTGLAVPGVEVTASVYRNDTNSVMFQYFRGFGFPVYYVRFDSLGQIAFSTNRIATEGPRE